MFLRIALIVIVLLLIALGWQGCQNRALEADLVVVGAELAEKHHALEACRASVDRQSDAVEQLRVEADSLEARLDNQVRIAQRARREAERQAGRVELSPIEQVEGQTTCENAITWGADQATDLTNFYDQ